MTDTNKTKPAKLPVFETDAVQADRAREQGLGFGARELHAQRDPGDVQSRDDENVRIEVADPDKDGLNQSPKVRGADDDEDGGAPNTET